MRKIKTAVILAGGKGRRLYPLTRDIPKVLIEVGGKPIIEHQILLLKEQGIKDIYILLGYLGEKIREYLKDGRKLGVKICYKQEKKLLGTAGALIQLKDKIKEDFLVLSGDVMLNFDFPKFINHHRQKKDSIASFAVHASDHPKDSDLVKIDGNGRIISLFKRPHSRGAELENLSIASVFIFSPDIFRYINQKRKFDIEKDVLPLILKSRGRSYGYFTPEYIKDMGTPERLRQVRKDYALGKIKKFNWIKEKTYEA